MRYVIFDTAWGAFGVVTRGGRVVSTYLPGRKSAVLRRIKALWPDATESRDALPSFRKQITAYFTGVRTRFSVALDVSSMSPFRQAVLQACRRIPYGRIASYADLARAAGSPGAARAVGSTMANNPAPLVIPCHRVLRSDGSVGGFSSPQGVKQKMRLLRLEGALSAMRSAR